MNSAVTPGTPRVCASPFWQTEEEPISLIQEEWTRP